MIFKPVVHSAQTMHLSCVKITTIPKQTETSIHLSIITWEYHRVCPKIFLSLWYIWHKPCTYLASTLTLSPSKLKWDSNWPTSPRNSIECVQTDFEACGMFSTTHAAILHQNYHYLETDKNVLPLEPRHLGVLSGASKMIYEPMILLAQIVHLSCTNTNTISKRTEMRFHMPTSPWSSIGCVQNDFSAYGTFGAIHAPISHWC
jgi:hypothetical protein